MWNRNKYLVICLFIFPSLLFGQNEVELLSGLSKESNPSTPTVSLFGHEGRLFLSNSFFQANERYGLASMFDVENNALTSLLDLNTSYRIGVSNLSYRSDFSVVGGMVFVDLYNGDSGSSLYRVVDGELVFLSKISDPLISPMIEVAGKIYFMTREFSIDSEERAVIWTTDGSEEGTGIVTSIVPVNNQNPNSRISSRRLTSMIAGDEFFLISLYDSYLRKTEFWIVDIITGVADPLEESGESFYFTPFQGPVSESITFFSEGFYFTGRDGPINNGQAGLYRLNENDLSIDVLLEDGTNVAPFYETMDFLTVEDRLYVQAYRGGFDLSNPYKLYEVLASSPSELVLRFEEQGQGQYCPLVQHQESLYFCAPSSNVFERTSVYRYDFQSLNSVELFSIGGSPDFVFNNVGTTLNFTEEVLFCSISNGDDRIYRFHLESGDLDVFEDLSIDFSHSLRPIKNATLVNDELYFLGSYPTTEGRSSFEVCRLGEDSNEIEVAIDLGTNNLHGVKNINANFETSLLFEADDDDSEAEFYIYSKDEMIVRPLGTNDSNYGGLVIGLLDRETMVFNVMNLNTSLFNFWVYDGESLDVGYIVNEQGEQEPIRLRYSWLVGKEDVPLWSSYDGDALSILGVDYEGARIILDTLKVFPASTTYLFYDKENPLWGSAENYGESEVNVVIRNMQADSLYELTLGDGIEKIFSIDYSGAFSYLHVGNNFDSGIAYYNNLNGSRQFFSYPEGVRLKNELTNEEANYVLGDRMIFEAYSNEFGEEYFFLDIGTEELGLLKDINPGPLNGTLPRSIRVEDLIYFVAEDPVNGVELWRTDGTTEGTWLVQDINPGYSFSLPNNLYDAGEFMIFSATGPLGEEVYSMRLDGSEEIQLVADLNHGMGSSMPSDFIEGDDAIYFRARPNDTTAYQLFRLPFTLLPVKEEVQASLAPTVFPNPANNQITIEAPGSEQLAEVTLYDSHGRQLLTSNTLAERLNLEISELPPATYWLLVRYASGAVSRQAVIKGSN